MFKHPTCLRVGMGWDINFDVSPLVSAAGGIAPLKWFPHTMYTITGSGGQRAWIEKILHPLHFRERGGSSFISIMLKDASNVIPKKEDSVATVDI